MAHRPVRRRAALLTGTSLIVAGMSVAVSLAVAPAALAAEECGDPSANGAAADEFTCATPPTYPVGVDYSTSTDGDLTLILQNRFDTGMAGVGGIRMFGDADEDMSLIREDDPAGAGDPRIVNTAGRAVDITTSGAGSILVELTDGDPTSGESTNATTGTAPIRITGSTDAIRAEATGAGDVSVIFAQTGTASGANHLQAAITAGAAGGSGIVARAASGDINLNATGASLSINSSNGNAGIDAATSAGGNIAIQTNSIQSRLYGIRAHASGDGNVNISTGGASLANNLAASVAAVDVSTGTGAISLTATGALGNNAGSHQYHAIRLVTGGVATLNLQSVGGAGLDGEAIVDITLVNGAEASITHAGLMGRGSEADRLMIEARGAGQVTLTSNGPVRGRVDFSELTGPVNWQLSGPVWATFGTNEFGAGGDTLSISSGTQWLAGQASTFNYTGSPIAAEETVIMFNGGEDLLTNAGTIVVGPNSITNGSEFENLEVELRLEGLERFDNSGLIMMGAAFQDLSRGTDGRWDDVLLMPGATFVGSGGSRIIMDVNLNRDQTACDTALRDEAFDMPAADCLGIQGGATEGVTSLVVKEGFPGDRGGNTRIVLVDVSGGTSGAGHFVLDPESSGYDAGLGAIDKGFFFYPLVYDESAQQHVLVGTPGGNALQYPLLAQAAHGVWRQMTGSWFDRQADLRGGHSDGGVWLRGSGEQAKRDTIQSADAAGAAFTFDNSFEQRTYSVSGGFDVLAGAGEDAAFVIGLMVGYGTSKIEFDGNPNEAQFDGFSGGAYGTFISGGFFVDAAVNANRLSIDHDVPGLDLFPAGTVTSTDLVSVGGQAEAGWRFLLADALFIEPLASVAYVKTEFDDLQIQSDDATRPGVSVEWDAPTSLRAALGARAGLEQEYNGFRAQYSVLGRIWNEFEDETDVVLHNLGSDFQVGNEFTGQFTEVAFGASAYSDGGRVSGFVNLGLKFGDDYQATNASAGVRVNW